MSAKAKLLVVDDDRLVLATVVHGLSQAGYEVVHADNGDDAILLAREHRPDLALLDIRMDGKSGFDVAEYLRDYLHLPFMFLSAFSDDATLAQVKALGAVAYLVKPLDVGQIIPALETALQQTQRPAAPASPVMAGAASEAVDLVSVAVGVLMHRYSLDRQQARARLENTAKAAGRSLPQHAAQLVDALEELVRPAG